MNADDKDDNLRIEIDRLVESIRSYSADGANDISFDLDRSEAVEKLAAFIRSYARRDLAFVNIGSST